ncbi:MAG: pyridoxine 5'-phosphate synthase [Bacteroidetes bacterium]|nr:pyridoxine 5'-phosphate synthase [Bacteroidota bacterium]
MPFSNTKLSVNINKLATIRNARGGNNPNLIAFVKKIESYGAQGITLHPRPDERHIRYQDTMDLKLIVSTEYNIEGNPTPDFIALVLQIKPNQVTLVPDEPNVLTSNQGWDTIKHEVFLKEIIALFKSQGIRTSIFLNPDPMLIPSAKLTGTDRIELYTESYASQYLVNKEHAIAPYIATAKAAMEAGIGINAGHDLDLNNLKYFAQNIPGLLEVSIGHALICDALEYGIANTVKMYLNQLEF